MAFDIPRPSLPSLGSVLPSSNQDNKASANELPSSQDAAEFVADKGIKLTTALDPHFYWASLSLQRAFDPYGTFNLPGYELFILDGSNNIVDRFTFPINPSSVSKSVPAAVVTTVTQRGITEEHNAAPLRRLAINGTFGILLDGPTTNVDKNKKSSGLLDYLFKDTIRGIQQTAANFQQLIGDEATVGISSSPLYDQNDTDVLSKTGFYFAGQFSKFIDSYLALKKTTAGRPFKFGFSNYKDDEHYLCTMNGYSIDKQAGSLEYRYALQLTAWKRTPAFDSFTFAPKVKPPISFGSVDAIRDTLRRLKAARNTLAGVRNTIAGIRNDVDRSFFQPIRELTVFAAEVIGTVSSVYDLVETVVNDSSRNAYFSASLSQAVSRLEGAASDFSRRVNGNASPRFNSLNATASNPDVASSLRAESQSASGAGTNQDTPLADALLRYPEDNISALDEVTIDEVQLTPQMRQSVNANLQKIRSYELKDLTDRRDSIASVMNSVNEFFGGADATYRAAKGLPPSTRNRKLTLDTIKTLRDMEECIHAANELIFALKQTQVSSGEQYLDYYIDAMVSAGITFNKPSSKFYVPMPSDATLEQLSLTYLGDSSRWIEIAAINGLKAPYIDEEGTKVQATSSGFGQTMTVSSPDGFYIGQTATVGSNTQRPEVRRVEKIDVLSEAETVVTLAGDPDLNKFKLIDGAYLLVYKPDTVNSNMLIAVPSSSPRPNFQSLATDLSKEDLTVISKVSGTDVLLNSAGDIAVTGTGDMKTVTGIANLVQAAAMKLKTPLGSIVSNPSYGSPLQPGITAAELDAKGAKQALSQLFARDPRFTGLQAGSLKVSGSVAVFNGLVSIEGVTKLLPVSVEVPKV